MSPASPYFALVAVAVPAATGVATLLLPRQALRLRVTLALAGPITALICLVLHLSEYGVSSSDSGTDVLDWMPSLHLNISFLIDGLGTFFALLVSGIGVVIVLYARSYFGNNEAALFRFYPMLGFFTTAMMGIVLADHMLLTIVFWELTSISSFLLIGWERENETAVKLAMQAFFTTAVGGLAFLGGVLLFGEKTDIWRWSDLIAGAGDLEATGPVVAAFVLMFVGAAAKSAQWPLHYWLPGAMAAPTPVSAYLHSATMVKAGIFLMGRMLPAFGVLSIWVPLAVTVGSITMLLGAVLALGQRDLKRIFAYLTVSQLGLMVAMYGFGGVSLADEAKAIDWDLTQIASHATYKAPLFMVAGAIAAAAGTRELPKLHGFWSWGDHRNKAIVVVVLLAGYALAGGPGTVSFVAKELFFAAAYHASQEHAVVAVVIAVAVLTAICNVAIFVRLATTLLGHQRGVRDDPQSPTISRDSTLLPSGPSKSQSGQGLMWVLAGGLVSLQYIGGLVPPLWNNVFERIETNIYDEKFEHGLPWIWQVVEHPDIPLAMSAAAIFWGVALGLSRAMRTDTVDVHDRIYPGTYKLILKGGFWTYRRAQTGHVRFYLVVVFLALLSGFSWALYLDPASFDVPEGVDLFEYLPGVALGLVVCATALALPLVHERVVKVLVLGSSGFAVVGLYLVYQAPDLALTQLMFEIIAVILFLMVLRLLPKPDLRPPVKRLPRAVLAIFLGASLGWMTLLAGTAVENRPDDVQTLGAFFEEHSLEGSEVTDGHGGEGKNVVNVILVDFRGFDTLGEITVLATAALGVWSLLPGRRAHRKDPDTTVQGAAR